MKVGRIKYKGGYKYQLVESVSLLTCIKPGEDILTKYIDLHYDGHLIIRDGYCWDGPSGPTIDTKNFMRGSLIHDALYGLMRQGKLLRSRRKDADLLLKQICLEDGMSRLRAWWVYKGVRLGAAPATKASAINRVRTAP